MAKTGLDEVHLMLMEQMQRLCEADKDELHDEIQRTEAMADISKSIVSNAALIIRAHNMTRSQAGAPKMLIGGEE